MEWKEDENGLLCVWGFDGGDTLADESRFWYGVVSTPMLEDRRITILEVIRLLQISPGIFVRNPRANPVVLPAKAWNDPTDVSRDQTTALIALLGDLKEYGYLSSNEILKLILTYQLKRFGLFPNKDIAGPSDWANYIRAFRNRWLWFLLPILDLELLVNSIIRIFYSLDNNADDLNHTVRLRQAQKIMPTPISYVARKLYKHFRNVQEAWNRYYAPTTGNNPLNEIYRKIIEEL